MWIYISVKQSSIKCLGECFIFIDRDYKMSGVIFVYEVDTFRVHEGRYCADWGRVCGRVSISNPNSPWDEPVDCKITIKPNRERVYSECNVIQAPNRRRYLQPWLRCTESAENKKKKKSPPRLRSNFSAPGWYLDEKPTPGLFCSRCGPTRDPVPQYHQRYSPALL